SPFLSFPRRAIGVGESEFPAPKNTRRRQAVGHRALRLFSHRSGRGGVGWDRREGGAMEPLEAAIAIVFNALLLVFMVKLFFAMFQMKLVVILFYLVVVLFALAFSGRGPAGF
uniref:Uncharacterized protein n=1 Tax=Aegilops tauschii subsp. strangulata TaxID=200361 RepID=A0A453H5E0_AEGTS